MNDLDLLKAVKSLSTEYILPISTVFDIVEKNILGSIQREHPDYIVEVSINRNTGHVTANKKFTVVTTVTKKDEITLDEAKKIDPNANIGDIVTQPINYNKSTRNTVTSFKHLLLSSLQEAKWLKQTEEYSNKIGDLVSGIVSRVEHGNVILKISSGTADAIIMREELMPQEILRPKDKVRGCIKKVQFSKNQPPVQLSRKSTDFLLQLLTSYIPEIEAKTITIKRIARDPGNRSKVAVCAQDTKTNPVGACVGYKANRVGHVSNECRGEKVEVIAFSENLPEFVMEALGNNIEVRKVVINEDNKNITVVTSEKSIKSAIGPRGQNAQLASQLVGQRIDIITEQEEKNQRAKKMQTVINTFVELLNVDELLAQLLYENYFTSVEDIANNKDDLSSMPGLTPEVVNDLWDRAQHVLAEKEKSIQKTLEELKIDKNLLDVPHMTHEIAITLGQHDINTLEGFAELSISELLDKDTGILRNNKLNNRIVTEMLLYSRRTLKQI